MWLLLVNKTNRIENSAYVLEMQNQTMHAKMFTWPNVEYRNTGISATVMAKAWMMGIPSACLNDISELKMPLSYSSPKLIFTVMEVPCMLRDQPADGLLMNHLSSSTSRHAVHAGPASDCRSVTPQ